MKILRARVLAGDRGDHAALPICRLSRNDHHAQYLHPAGYSFQPQLSGVSRALFLVLLRIAIGWHFLTEGVEKVDSTRYGKQPFSAEIYLRNSVGPLAPQFRAMLPDADGEALLDEAKLKASWGETVDRVANHYKFNDDQKSKAKALLDQAGSWAEVWFNAYDNREARRSISPS